MAAMKAPCSLRQGQAARDARRLSANLDLAARVAFSALRREGKLWALSETQINLAKRNENGLVENIWDYLRSNFLSHCVWDIYEAILDACCDAWNALMAKSEVIVSIGTREWAQVKT